MIRVKVVRVEGRANAIRVKMVRVSGYGKCDQGNGGERRGVEGRVNVIRVNAVRVWHM